MRLHVLVEGQTEQEFVKLVLAPHLQALGVWVYSTIVQTSRDSFGRKRRGGGQWKNWRQGLVELTREQRGNDVRFTTMFDLYGLPDDFPELDVYGKDQDTLRRAEKLEAAMAREVDDHRLIPYLQRHEFEALVFAGLDNLEKMLDSEDLKGLAILRNAVQNMHPEDINDGPTSAPSKRLVSCIANYRKTVHGPLALEETGILALRQKCPRFDAWVTKLEALGSPSREGDGGAEGGVDGVLAAPQALLSPRGVDGVLAAPKGQDITAQGSALGNPTGNVS